MAFEQKFVLSIGQN
uniref:Uncharacterized protein n=1 Tax=Rhizophora mucronata TaxID=61149 RepID=A0A2P2IJI4_RHIMU